MTEQSTDSPRPGTPGALSDAWSGRDDGPGPEHLRWHTAVRPWNAGAPAADRDDAADAAATRPAVLLGFASDEGVRRNRGRTGAAAGPDALRSALAPLAFPAGAGPLLDAGDTAVVGTELEAGQARLGERIAGVLDGGALAVVLGGGHETAYASYLGLAGSSLLRGGADGTAPRLGILNLDAHFDLRDGDVPSSGTPFLQIARDEEAAGRGFDYAVVGISPANNTRVLFDTAERLGVRHLRDDEAGLLQLERVRDFVRGFIDSVDVLYLTVDLDVLPAAVAPGVSAPAGYGVPFEVVHDVVRQATASGKLALADVVELNPALDADSRTARAAARLIHTVVAEHRAPGS